MNEDTKLISEVKEAYEQLLDETPWHSSLLRRLLARIAELEAENAKLREVANALADKVDATSDCDHKRMSCAEVGCIGVEVKSVRAALAAKEVAK